MPHRIPRHAVVLAGLVSASLLAATRPGLTNPSSAGTPVPICAQEGLGLCHLGHNTRSHGLVLAGALAVDPMLATHGLLEGAPAFTLTGLASRDPATAGQGPASAAPARPAAATDAAGVLSDNLFLPSDNVLQISQILFSSSTESSPYRAYFVRRLSSAEFIRNMLLLLAIFAAVIAAITYIYRFRFFNLLTRESTAYTSELARSIRSPKPIKRRARSM